MRARLPTRDGRRLAGVALGLIGASLLVGVLVGLLWWTVAPRAGATVVPGGVGADPLRSSAYVAADGWFGVLGLVVGAVAGVLAYRWRRPDVTETVAASAGLAIGGVLGAVVAWRVGVALEPAGVLDAARGLPVGAPVEVPLRLRALGVLMAWPLAGVITHAALVMRRERH